MRKLILSIGTFIILYIIGTIVGFAAFLLISPLAMIISMFTVMPVICIFLIYWYLRRIAASPNHIGREVLIIIVTWMVLSFSFDALMYILIVPTIMKAPPHWQFFIEQSPWIWFCYAMLFVCGYAARWLYLKRPASPSSD